MYIYIEREREISPKKNHPDDFEVWISIDWHVPLVQGIPSGGCRLGGHLTVTIVMPAPSYGATSSWPVTTVTSVTGFVLEVSRCFRMVQVFQQNLPRCKKPCCSGVAHHLWSPTRCRGSNRLIGLAPRIASGIGKVLDRFKDSKSCKSILKEVPSTSSDLYYHIIKTWSKDDQNMIKRWSKDDQKKIKRWSKDDQVISCRSSSGMIPSCRWPQRNCPTTHEALKSGNALLLKGGKEVLDRRGQIPNLSRKIVASVAPQLPLYVRPNNINHIL